MSKHISVIVICLMISLGSCHEEKNKSIAVNKLIFSEIIGEHHEEVNGDTTIYLSVLVPGTTYKIEGSKIELFKPGDDIKTGNNSWIDSSFTGYLSENVIEKINNGLKSIGFKNKTEEDLIDSAKLNESCCTDLIAQYIPHFSIEYENKMKIYGKRHPYYYKKAYNNFVAILKGIKNQVKLKYLRDTLLLKMEREDIKKYFSTIKSKSILIKINKRAAHK